MYNECKQFGSFLLDKVVTHTFLTKHIKSYKTLFVLVDTWQFQNH